MYPEYTVKDAPAILAPGATLNTSGTSAYVAIPNTKAGVSPLQVRLACTAACYFRMGAETEATAVIAAAGTGYANGDTITLTGGTFSVATILNVTHTKLISTALNAPGTGYVPADTITLLGGTAGTKAILTVTHTQVVSAAIDVAGTGGTPGAATVTGTTGTGTKFQAAVTISAGGIISAVGAITVAGDYTVNPTDIAHEPVTGGSLVGAQLSVVVGVKTYTVSTAGDYTVNAVSFTQFATTGTGVGATFNTASYGVLTATVNTYGDYSVDPANPVSQGSTSGTGSGATFTMTQVTAATSADTLLNPGPGEYFAAYGCDHISAIQVSGAGVLQISPVEN